MSSRSEVPLCHQGDNELPLTQVIHEPLRLRGGAALHRQIPGRGGAGDQGVIGAAFAAPVPVLVGPLGHPDRAHQIACEGGDRDGHGGGAAAVSADVVRAVGLVGIAVILLVELEHLSGSVCETDIPKRRDAVGAAGVLEHSVAQEYTEILRVIVGKFLLLVGEMEDVAREIRLPLIRDSAVVPDLCSALIGLGIRIIWNGAGRKGPREGAEVLHTIPKRLLQIGKRDARQILAPEGAVLPDNGVGVAQDALGIGADDRILASASLGEVVGDPLLHVVDPLAQHQCDRKSDFIGPFDNGRVIIEDRLSTRIGAAAGQPSENQGGQQDKERREQEQNDHDCGDFACMVPAFPESAGDCAVWPRSRGAFGRRGDGISVLTAPCTACAT